MKLNSQFYFFFFVQQPGRHTPNRNRHASGAMDVNEANVFRQMKNADRGENIVQPSIWQLFLQSIIVGANCVLRTTAKIAKNEMSNVNGHIVLAIGVVRIRIWWRHRVPLPNVRNAVTNIKIVHHAYKLPVLTADSLTVDGRRN